MTDMLKITKGAITHRIKELQALNFKIRMAKKGFMGADVKIPQWAWHRPLLGKSYISETTRHISTKFGLCGYLNISITYRKNRL